MFVYCYFYFDLIYVKIGLSVLVEWDIEKYIVRIRLVFTYLLSTLISFSKESSFPLSAFLSIIFTAYSWLLFSLLSAKRTSEKAPLKIEWEKRKPIKKKNICELLMDDENERTKTINVYMKIEHNNKVHKIYQHELIANRPNDQPVQSGVHNVAMRQCHFFFCHIWMINESNKRFSIILTSIKLLRVYANMYSISDIFNITSMGDSRLHIYLWLLLWFFVRIRSSFSLHTAIRQCEVCVRDKITDSRYTNSFWFALCMQNSYQLQNYQLVNVFLALTKSPLANWMPIQCTNWTESLTTHGTVHYID